MAKDRYDILDHTQSPLFTIRMAKSASGKANDNSNYLRMCGISVSSNRQHENYKFQSPHHDVAPFSCWYRGVVAWLLSSWFSSRGGPSVLHIPDSSARASDGSSTSFLLCPGQCSKL